MLKWTDFSIGGYNFDDWSLVKELYIPASVSSGTTKTLHDRSKDEYEHHLQHYFIPTDKAFIALRTTVQMSADTIGIFGTATRYLKGVTPAWVDTGFDYWANIHLVIHNTIVYKCILRHSTPVVEPGVTPGWDTYWKEGEVWQEAWETGLLYLFNQFVQNDGSGYRCTADHTAGDDDDEPCSGENWATYWDIGDEMIADRTISRFYLNISEGHNCLLYTSPSPRDRS